MADKTKLPVTDVTGKMGVAAKTISSISLYKHGIVTVIEMRWSDTTVTFMKHRGEEWEHGGTNEWGTGTKVNL